MNNCKNATWLFEKPYPDMHSSESLWTSLFSIFIICASQKSIQFDFPLYYIDDQDHYYPKLKAGKSFKILPSLSFDRNIIVEGNMSYNVFQDLPGELSSLRPDIMILKDEQPSIMIEVKTTGRHRIGTRQLGLYEKMQEFFCNLQVYYLISCGHESNSDLDLLAKAKSDILLWEDIFPQILQSRFLLNDCLKGIDRNLWNQD